MKKADLIELFGNTPKTAAALRMSTSGIEKWPAGELSTRNADRAIGACLRVKGLAISRANFPEMFMGVPSA